MVDSSSLAFMLTAKWSGCQLKCQRHKDQRIGVDLGDHLVQPPVQMQDPLLLKTGSEEDFTTLLGVCSVILLQSGSFFLKFDPICCTATS